MSKDLLINIALAFIGKPYIWGGDDPIKGFDCSGFIIELLKSIAVIKRDSDYTAHELSKILKETTEIEPGNVVFYDFENSGKAGHVELILTTLENGKVLTIGASGGNEKTKEVNEAIKDNGYIKVREMRSEVYKIAKPELLTD